MSGYAVNNKCHPRVSHSDVTKWVAVLDYVLLGLHETTVVQWILTKACFAVWTMFYD